MVRQELCSLETAVKNTALKMMHVTVCHHAGHDVWVLFVCAHLFYIQSPLMYMWVCMLLYRLSVLVVPRQNLSPSCSLSITSHPQLSCEFSC